MEFRQLTYFLAAAHTQNFRQAAELCLVTQPALSRQIAALEKELHIVLFKRVKQHVVLTDAGQTFVSYAKEALEVLQSGEQELVRWQEGLGGTLLIGCNQALATAFLPNLVAAFHKQYPAIHLKIEVTHSEQVIAQVERGEVELGCLYDPIVRSELVTSQELFREPLQLLVPLSHPLAQIADQERTLQRILVEPLILMGETTRLRKVLDRLFLQRGLTVQPIVEIDSIGGLKELVKQGCGITLLSPTLLWPQEANEGLISLPIADVSEIFISALVHRRIGTLSLPARQFISVVKQAIPDP
jgi:DNA-binding transcriptional LysR family regulator